MVWRKINSKDQKTDFAVGSKVINLQYQNRSTILLDEILDETSSTLYIYDAQYIDAGKYECVVDFDGEKHSLYHEVKIKGILSIHILDLNIYRTCL